MPKKPEWMRNAGRGLALAMAINLMLIFILISPGTSFELSADSVTAGENLIITGTSEPNSENTFISSFTMNLPVTSEKYSYETEVKVPNKPNRFTVTAKNVQNLDAGVKMGIWITKSFESRDGVVHLSAADIPTGRYKLKVSGSAMPGANEVPITIEAETGVLSDSSGSYKLVIDTTGIPEGDYLIEGDGDEKTVRILSKGESSSSASAISEAEKEIAAYKDKIEINLSAAASESAGGKSVNEEVSKEEKATPPAESAESKGVVAWLTDFFLGQ
ncbi:MAG: hypothetical protein AB7E62_11315 [Methanothrix sp.]